MMYAGRKKNSIRDARTPHPGEIFFNTIRYRSSITVQSSRYFKSSVSYIKVQIMLYFCNNKMTALISKPKMAELWFGCFEYYPCIQKWQYIQ